MLIVLLRLGRRVPRSVHLAHYISRHPRTPSRRPYAQSGRRFHPRPDIIFDRSLFLLFPGRISHPALFSRCETLLLESGIPLVLSAGLFGGEKSETPGWREPPFAGVPRPAGRSPDFPRNKRSSVFRNAASVENNGAKSGLNSQRFPR